MFIEYIIAIVSSFIIDFIWLGIVSKSLYEKYIGNLMVAKVKLIPGAIFYLIFGLAIVVFVVHPALKNNWSTGQLILHSALLGLVIYGGYDLTNLALLKGWPIGISLIDMTWGVVLTTLVSIITVVLSKVFIK